MKNILIIVTQDFGGAGEAMFKLAKMLNSEHRVALLVKKKTKHDKFIYQYNISSYQILKKKFFNKFFSIIKQKQQFLNKYNFYALDEYKKNTNPKKIIKKIGFVPEYIFNGWSSNFMNSTDLLNLQLLTKAEVYNITVDMNHFTGGCHYSWDCKKYITGCDIHCPALELNHDKTIALKNFNKKFLNSKKGDFKILAGSGWTLKQAQESKIYREQQIIYNINSLIDTEIMNNNCRNIAKQIFGLDTNYFYVLAGCKDATDPRKGFDYFVKGLEILYKKIDKNISKKIKVLIVTDTIDYSNYELIHFEKKYIDFVKDYRLLSLVYQSADLYVNTSIEDSGPMMVSEALACGTPVVGFDMGIVNNMVVNDYNGYKAILKDSYDLANGIYKIFNLNEKEYLNYSNNAVISVKNHASLDYGKKIINKILYQN